MKTRLCRITKKVPERWLVTHKRNGHNLTFAVKRITQFTLLPSDKKLRIRRAISTRLGGVVLSSTTEDGEIETEGEHKCPRDRLRHERKFGTLPKCGDRMTFWSHFGHVLVAATYETMQYTGLRHKGERICRCVLKTLTGAGGEPPKPLVYTSPLFEQGFGMSVAPISVNDVVPKPLDKRIDGTEKLVVEGLRQIPEVVLDAMHLQVLRQSHVASVDTLNETWILYLSAISHLLSPGTKPGVSNLKVPEDHKFRAGRKNFSAPRKSDQ
uniref:Uncharacterized protein n=1 Tax=Timema tahoe TaxID=61484 RepID=A0A7R9IBM6_9NEOP|nr:unnamed protein product [Timema tahoe]